MPNCGQSGDGSATPTPPTQATERPAGGSPSESRIPSHVFARTTTTGPTEWSVASNESLFSIHMENTSLSRDRLSWISKSGEFGCNSDSAISSPLVDIPSNLTPTRKSTESAKKSGNLNDDGRYGVSESAVAAETMREVLREKESQHIDNVAKESPHFSSMSQHSDGSVKSFAFPILTGDADKNGPLIKNSKNKKQLSRPSTPETTPHIPSETAKTPSPPGTPKPQSASETPKSQTPKATQNGGPRRWFSCFSCCPSRSCT
ncbi:putative protein TPRXL [Durio zibethinus]|uniref:Uncharacterized protein n=1 Tax=Durio zibethinus TaxID=66656 RepID=A0A6P5YA15_DURZI|nr:putative protein TPRXL [Durio zibethinus]